MPSVAKAIVVVGGVVITAVAAAVTAEKVDVAGGLNAIGQWLRSGSAGSSGEMAAETMVSNFQRQQAAKLDQSPMQASERNPKQDKLLTDGEIDKLENAGYDVHEIKGGDNASKKDLYKDKQGNVYVKPKGGQGPGDETGINLNDLDEKSEQ